MSKKKREGEREGQNYRTLAARKSSELKIKLSVCVLAQWHVSEGTAKCEARIKRNICVQTSRTARRAAGWWGCHLWSGGEAERCDKVGEGGWPLPMPRALPTAAQQEAETLCGESWWPRSQRCRVPRGCWECSHSLSSGTNFVQSFMPNDKGTDCRSIWKMMPCISAEIFQAYHGT